MLRLVKKYTVKNLSSARFYAADLQNGRNAGVRIRALVLRDGYRLLGGTEVDGELQEIPTESSKVREPNG